MGLPDDLELLELFDGNLEDVDASVSQVEVFYKHVSFCSVSRVSEATLLLSAVVLVTVCRSHPMIANLQRLVARARRARGRERLLRTMVVSFQTLVH